MRIVRAPRNSHFTVLSNDLIEDSRLSFKARGLLAYLLSRPDGWQTDAGRLASQGPDGRSAILAGLKELEKAGYLKRTRSQGERGRWSTACEVFDTPTGVRFSDVGSPAAGLPNAGQSASKTKTESKVPPTPQGDALGEPCERHAKTLGRRHHRCRACGTAGRPKQETPSAPPFADWKNAERCAAHGEFVGRCALCRTQGDPS